MPAIRHLYGLFGDPVDHSLSPEIHAAAFETLGWPGAYLPFHVQPQRLEAAFDAARVLGVQGLNVTIPHKERAATLCDEVRGDAEAIGAVNVVVRSGDAFIGHNTDTTALTRALAGVRHDVQGQRVLILGAGGAARAAAYALGRAGAAELLIANRTFARAQELAQSLASHGIEALPAPLTPASVRELLPLAGVVVNATSVGLQAADESPVPENASFDHDTVAVDMVYRPLKTRFLQQARSHGARTVDGLELLVQQGIASLSLWLGKPVDAGRLAPVMRAAALEALL